MQTVLRQNDKTHYDANKIRASVNFGRGLSRCKIA